MKKGIKLLLSLLMFLPIIVLADAAAPDYVSYDVEVIKNEGIDYYDYKGVMSGTPSGHLDKGTKLRIEFDAKYNNEKYLYGIYDKNGVYVKESDVVAVGEFGVDHDRVIDTEEDHKIKITDEVIIRKGPAESFPEVGRIKKDEATFRYTIAGANYIYVDYKGTKGWVDLDSEGLMYSYGDIITFSSFDGGQCGIIPKSTVIKDVWVPGLYATNTELEYKNCKFNADLIRMEFTKVAKVKKVYKVNSKMSFTSDDDKNIVIDKGDEITVLSEEFDSYYYVEVGKGKGWLDIDLEQEATYVKDLKDEKEKKHHKDDDEDEEKDTNVIILACVVGGVAFALGAIMTLILVNRKKKLK